MTARQLDPLVLPENDPVLAAILRAPVSDEPYTDEERAADDAAIEDIRAGRAHTLGQDEILAVIDEMRRR